jgi:hypothetical protein
MANFDRVNGPIDICHWTSIWESEKRTYIWELDADLRIGRRSESYIYIYMYCISYVSSGYVVLKQWWRRDKTRFRVHCNSTLADPNPNLTLTLTLTLALTLNLTFILMNRKMLVPSPSLFQNHVLTGVTSFEVYVSDVIGRQFEKVKNGHIFENWMPIW